MPQPFTSLPLRPELLDALEQVGFVEMTPIQARALPVLLTGADVTGRAMTGSGKTAAFGLALLQPLDPSRAVTQALVLCPTRELAEQVTEQIRTLAKRLAHTRVQSLCGGRPIRPQILSLEHGPQVVVGTPGRVADHLRRGTLRLGDLRVLVLDEADRMLDLGFADEVLAIAAQAPAERQTLLFSATFADATAAVSSAVQRAPVFVEVDARVGPEVLRQQVVRCEPAERVDLVADLLAELRPAAALVFCETRGDCDAVAASLAARGASALALHGQMAQRDRDDALLRFSNGSLRVLVATNVAARGLDITGLPLVLIAELSPDPDSHVHRIGRTGRAGEPGLAISLVAGPAEEARLARIEAAAEPLEARPRPGPGGALDGLAASHRTLVLLAGRRDKLRKGDVLGALVKDAGLAPEAIGAIDLTDRTCAVAVVQEAVPRAMAYLRGGKIKNRRVRALWL